MDDKQEKLQREKLQREKLILKEALANPGVQLLFSKLNEAAEKLPHQMLYTFDNRQRDWLRACYEAFSIIPEQILEVVMNCDFEELKKKYPTKERWSFRAFLNKCRLTAERED